MIEFIRLLRLARESAVKAPSSLRESINAKSGRGKSSQCAKLRPDTTRLSETAQAVKMTLRALAKRIQTLEEEIALLDAGLDPLVKQSAPTLLTRIGIGTQHGAQLLITAGENIERLSNEAAFARLCGVAPIPVSSGYTHRMRLHRGGDRKASRALHMIAVCRLRYDPRTIDYMNRRRAEGLSKKDVLRCLKRYIAREVFKDCKSIFSQVRT